MVFKPFLRPVAGEDRAWGDTVWLTELLNELRKEAGEKPARRDNVLQSTRKVMKKLGDIGLLNFQESDYVNIQGKSQPMLRFSDAVLLNVVAEIGGKVEHKLLYNAGLELNLNTVIKIIRRSRKIDQWSKYQRSYSTLCLTFSNVSIGPR
jgi:hypothetical protein